MITEKSSKSLYILPTLLTAWEGENHVLTHMCDVKANFTQNDMPVYDLEGNTELEAEVVDSFDVIGLVLVGRIAVVCSDVETKVSLIEREEGHA